MSFVRSSHCQDQRSVVWNHAFQYIGRHAPCRCFGSDAAGQGLRFELEVAILWPLSSLSCQVQAGVAQLVERQLPKLDVASSNLVARSMKASAELVELVDTQVLGTCAFGVWVRVPRSAPFSFLDITLYSPPALMRRSIQPSSTAQHYSILLCMPPNILYTDMYTSKLCGKWYT